MSKLLEELKKEAQNQEITFILTNGFHLHGTLMDSDEVHLKVQTKDYGSLKEILVYHNAVSTIIPKLIK